MATSSWTSDGDVRIHDRRSRPTHYGLADRDHHAKGSALVDDRLDEHSVRLKVTPGKMVYELQPKDRLAHGQRVLHLLPALPFDADDVLCCPSGTTPPTRTRSGRWPDGASASSSAARMIGEVANPVRCRPTSSRSPPMR